MKIPVVAHAGKPHPHTAQDKVYYVLKGAGRFSLGEREETLVQGEPIEE